MKASIALPIITFSFLSLGVHSIPAQAQSRLYGDFCQLTINESMACADNENQWYQLYGQSVMSGYQSNNQEAQPNNQSSEPPVKSCFGEYSDCLDRVPDAYTSPAQNLDCALELLACVNNEVPGLISH